MAGVAITIICSFYFAKPKNSSRTKIENARLQYFLPRSFTKSFSIKNDNMADALKMYSHSRMSFENV